ncbi:DUF1014-domain-containing protein [Aaosphaeria arxii CBS 175.79]|uniref:DUF1014-domain-containing protein n=1 Tax=Aaosphaeria arxii CBS 175.79 TaxID=1450172 RepID=A0A6A5Y7N4_9PLEO|nr:DUF1014-domain-containing protein [Aaosphaeria arxii CBS 175.79]KAF2020751.1 DUF1014-domain-containing protein [Aaosphaeria arxii CBS 175.79]
MGPKRGGAEGSKKAQGQARKAEQAASKQAVKDRQAEEAEAEKWGKGAKSTSKADAAAAKAADAARKKAEKAALLAEEEANQPSKPKGAGSKSAQKKTNNSRGIDSAFASFDQPSALNATGIDNALDALDLTGNNNADKVERHPERRFKAAYTQYEERRLEEMKDEKGLRRQQKIDIIRKEFEKHPDNPFNQVSVSYNATKDDVANTKESERQKKEKRLGGPSS